MGAGASASEAGTPSVVQDTSLSMEQCCGNPIILKHLLLKHEVATAPSRKLLDFILAVSELQKIEEAGAAKIAADSLLQNFLVDDAPFLLDDSCQIDQAARTECVAAAAVPVDTGECIAHYTTVLSAVRASVLGSIEQISWTLFIEDDAALQALVKEKALKMIGVVFNADRKRLQMGS